MRLFRRGRSREEQYRRYKVAREAVWHGALSPLDPSIVAARAEMLNSLGPAFDPTMPGWYRLGDIDPGLVAFMAGSVDAAVEDHRDLEVYAEQILAIVALEIDPVTPDVLLEVGRNFVAEAAAHHAADLVASGVPESVAHKQGFDEALVVARRLLASTRATP